MICDSLFKIKKQLCVYYIIEVIKINNKAFCLNRRTIFDFYTYHDCEKCCFMNDNEEIRIGNKNIFLYYLRKCDVIEYDIDLLFLYSNKVKLFLKDCIINQNLITFLIFDDFRMNSLYSLEELLEFGSDIHILII